MDTTHALPVRRDVGDGDGRARHGRASRIVDDAGDLTGGDLGEEGRGARGEAPGREQGDADRTETGRRAFSLHRVLEHNHSIPDVMAVQIDLNRCRISIFASTRWHPYVVFRF